MDNNITATPLEESLKLQKEIVVNLHRLIQLAHQHVVSADHPDDHYMATEWQQELESLLCFARILFVSTK